MERNLKKSIKLLSISSQWLKISIYLSWPAVSQRASLTSSPSTSTSLILNSTPMVYIWSWLCTPWTYWLSRLVFPTPELPSRIIFSFTLVVARCFPTEYNFWKKLQSNILITYYSRHISWVYSFLLIQCHIVSSAQSREIRIVLWNWWLTFLLSNCHLDIKTFEN